MWEWLELNQLPRAFRLVSLHQSKLFRWATFPFKQGLWIAPLKVYNSQQFSSSRRGKARTLYILGGRWELNPTAQLFHASTRYRATSTLVASSPYPLFDVALGTAISLVAFLLTTELPKATKNRRPLKQVAAADEVIVLPILAIMASPTKASCVGVAPIISFTLQLLGHDI